MNEFYKQMEVTKKYLYDKTLVTSQLFTFMIEAELFYNLIDIDLSIHMELGFGIPPTLNRVGKQRFEDAQMPLQDQLTLLSGKSVPDFWWITPNNPGNKAYDEYTKTMSELIDLREKEDPLSEEVESNWVERLDYLWDQLSEEEKYKYEQETNEQIL